MRFRLITYNIHKCIGGVDRRYRPQRVIETLAHYDADIVLLQEVADGVPGSRHHRQMDFLGDGLNLRYRAYQCNVKLARRHYGNAILSRFPLAEIRDLELTLPMKKRRRAMIAYCRVREEHERRLLLFNCHLGLAEFERAIQLQWILGSDALKRVHATTPVVVAGDYNDMWGTLGRRLMEPNGFTPACRLARTFPAIMPIRPLDRIYYRGSLELHRGFPCRREIARQASDHLPLIADFELSV